MPYASISAYKKNIIQTQMPHQTKHVKLFKTTREIKPKETNLKNETKAKRKKQNTKKKQKKKTEHESK